jgi:Spy/CpxP family protein refolding chaperone
MRYVTWVLMTALGISLGAASVSAGPARPAFHEEAGWLADEIERHLDSLRARIEQHLHHGRSDGGRSDGGRSDGPAAAAVGRERPLITMMLHHRTELGLSDDQVKQLEALRSDFTREAIRREAEIRVAELDLAALLGQESVDMTKVEAKVRESAQHQADLRIARLRAIEQGKMVLTAEQRSRFQAILGGRSPRAGRQAAGSLRM